MDEQDIQMLQVLSQTQNITKTAKKLYTTQSALTKRLQKLEEDLGCQLFIRSRKGILLTPTAEQILPYVDTISHSMEYIRSHAASAQGEVSGTLHVGVSVNIARYRLPHILKAYMTQYPKVAVHVTTKQSTGLYKALAENEISIAIVRGEFQWKEGAVTLSEEPVCLVVSKEHADTPLDQLPYIGRHTDPVFFDLIEQWKKENHYENIPTQLWIDDISSCLEMVTNGIGWAILPQICLKNFTGSVTPLSFQDGTSFTRSTHILYKHDYFELPQVKTFIRTALADEYYTTFKEELPR